MVLVFHHVMIFLLLSDWLIQNLPLFWFCYDVACFCFGSETQLKCTYRRCCQFFKNIVLCLDVLSGRESASMATFFFMTLLLFSRMLRWPKETTGVNDTPMTTLFIGQQNVNNPWPAKLTKNKGTYRDITSIENLSFEWELLSLPHLMYVSTLLTLVSCTYVKYSSTLVVFSC